MTQTAHATPTVRSGDGIIHLDLTADEYACHYEASEPSGLSEGGPPRLAPWSPSPEPGLLRPNLADWWRFGRACIRARKRFKDRSLSELGAIAQTLGHGASPRDCPSVFHKAAVFRTMLLVLPRRPACLAECFLLLHFLDQYGLSADWVFAAHLFPFRAHCWLAVGTTLVNEAPYRIEDYHVIWTVGRTAP